MIQVGSAGNVRDPDVSGFRKVKTARDTEPDMGFAALLEKKTVKPSEAEEQKESEATENRGQEEQKEAVCLQLSGTWLMQQENLIQQTGTPDPAEGQTEAFPTEILLSGLPEAVIGEVSDQAAQRDLNVSHIQLDSAAEVTGAFVVEEELTEPRKPFEIQKTEDSGQAVLENGGSGRPADRVMEPESSRTVRSFEEVPEEEGKRTFLGQENSGAEAAAAVYRGAEIRESWGARNAPGVSSGPPAPRTYTEEPIRMHTGEHTLVRDTAELLISRAPLKAGVLELELEPASMGKLTIRVAFETGKTAVTMMSSNSETLEILSKNAAQIAQILEERTGQPIIIYTPQTTEQGEDPAKGQQGRQENRQQGQNHRKEQGESFAQQLRLGLV